MTCFCPKCDAQIEFDPADIPAEGAFNKCSECSTNFVIRKESFARRALHKSDNISCAECGSHPGASIYCQACHAIYPDFLVVETSSAAKKQLGKILASLNVLKNLKIGGSAKPSYERQTASPIKPGKAKGLSLPGQPAQIAAVIATIIIFAAAGGYYWYQNKLETQYSRNYVRALFVIKTSRDFEIRVSNRLAAAMKTGAAAALTPDEQKSAAAGKTDVDMLIKRLGKVPKKFTASNDALIKLNESYAKLHSTVASPAGMSDTYLAAVKKTENDFIKVAGELKAGLPEKISTQLAESRKKYKQLQDF